MSAEDPTLLYDTIRITGHFALQKKIKETLPSFPDVEEGTISTSFTPHRQRLMKLGKKLTAANVMQIDGFYNTPRKMYTDSWSMITDLEDRLEISEGNMTVFMNSLILLKLHLALTALTEDSMDPPHRPVFTDSPHGEQMAELSVADFNQLLDVVSSWWERLGSVNMLKVLLSEFDCIQVTKLQELNKPIKLFRLLLGDGLISQSNIDVLAEVVILCEQRGVESTIKKMVPTFPDLSKVEIRNFSDHRRNLLKFGTAMNKDNIARIGYLYDLNVKELTDPWCLILELENRKKLTAHTKEEFIKLLREHHQIILPR